MTVSVKSYGSYGVAITAEASARHHGSDYGVPMKGTLSKLTIVDAGDDLSSQALLDATYPIDDFSDYGITLVSVSSDSFSKNENFTEKANTLQELIESGIFPIFEGEEKNGDSSDEEVEKARKPIKDYVYIRKTNRGVDTGEPREMGVVAWGVKEAGDGNGYRRCIAFTGRNQVGMGHSGQFRGHHRCVSHIVNIMDSSRKKMLALQFLLKILKRTFPKMAEESVTLPQIL